MLLCSALAVTAAGRAGSAHDPTHGPHGQPLPAPVYAAAPPCTPVHQACNGPAPIAAAPQAPAPSAALQWLTGVTQLLGAVAWPLVALVLAFAMRREMAALLARVRRVEMGQGKLILDREFGPAPVDRQREKSRQEAQEAEGDAPPAASGEAPASQQPSPASDTATAAPARPPGDPLLAEALALRALQEEYGVPIGRQLAAGEGPVYDGVFALGERLYIVEVKLYRKRVASAKLSATLAALAQAIRARGWQHTRIVLVAVFDQPDDLSTQLALLHAAADATPSVPVIVRCFTLADLQRRFDAQGAESAQAPPGPAP